MRVTQTLAAILLALVSAATAAPRTAVARSAAPAAASRVDGDVAHGQYIAEHVAMCVECHSGRDAGGTILDAQRYMGAPIPVKPDNPNDWAIRAPRNRGLP